MDLKGKKDFQGEKYKVSKKGAISIGPASQRLSYERWAPFPVTAAAEEVLLEMPTGEPTFVAEFEVLGEVIKSKQTDILENGLSTK